MSQQTSAPASVVYPPIPGDPASPGRITRQFEALRSRGEKALIAFVTAGDGGLDLTRRLVLALAADGADVIELGIPFSDPLLDGPVIQAGSQRALDGGTRVAAIFDLVADLRSEMQTPLIFMTCVNPIRRMGMQRFARRAAEVGVDGLLITDLPPEEAGDWIETARDHNLDRVFMLAPTSSPLRIAAVAKAASGFIYCQSRAGVTGISQGVPDDLGSLVQRVRSESGLPLGVGFGISTPEQVRSVVAVADGAVVGTAFVRLAAEHLLDPAAAAASVSDLARRLKQATRG